MPKRHRKFIIAISIIAILSLPFLSLPAKALAKEGYANFAEQFAAKAAATGFAIGFSLDKTISFAIALPAQTTHALAHLIDYTSESIFTAVEDIATNIKAQVSSVAQRAKEDGHQMLRSLPEMTYQIKNTALSLVNYESGIMNYGKNNTRNAMIHDSSFMFDNPPSFAQETTQVGASLPRLAERIIERILVKEVNQESRIMNQGSNDNSNTSMIHDS